MPTSTPNVEDWRASGVTDTGTITAAINAMNTAGAPNVLDFQPKTYVLTAALPPITCDHLILNGRQAELRQNTAFAGAGNFFTLGTSTEEVNNTHIRDFRLQLNATLSDPLVWAIDVPFANSCSVDNIYARGLYGVVDIGAAATRSTRCRFTNFNGDFNKGNQTDGIIRVNRGAACMFRDWVMSGTGAGVKPEAMVKFNPPYIEPVPGEEYDPAVVDTFTFENVKLQSFTEGSTTESKQFGVYIDRRKAAITNLWFNDCVFDHTREAGFWFIAGPPSAGADDLDTYTRFVSVKNTRFATDGGRGALITVPAGSGLVRGIQFEGNLFQVEKNFPAFELDAPDRYVDVAVVGNTFNETGPDTKGQAIRMNGKGWLVHANKIGNGGNAATTKFAVGVRIVGATSSEYVNGDNQVQANAIAQQII